MYAPNTYNGAYEENLSSISEKSETYSNVSPEYNVSIQWVGNTSRRDFAID